LSVDTPRTAISKPTAGWLLAILACLTLPGCQTVRSWDAGCPGIYSGVRYYASQRDSLPWDGRVFFTLDLPLTAVVDTLLLPASAFVDRQIPQSGWVPGCSWAK
jgi:uncharacterized protein YceK